jgi:hypothetical protein
VFALLSAPAIASAGNDPSATSFIKTFGTNFALDGRPFFVEGVINHDLTLGSTGAVNRVLDDAVAMGANMVRTFLVPAGHANIIEKMSDLTTPTLDFGTWHGYPLFYRLTPAQFNDTITEFCGLATRVKNPVLFEEFGYARSNRDSVESYAMWLDTLTRDRSCAGWMVWRLVSLQNSGPYPVDQVEHFDVHNDGCPLWNVLRAATARAMQTRKAIAIPEGSR